MYWLVKFISVTSDAEPALLDDSICSHAMALWGVVRSAVLVPPTRGHMSGIEDVFACWLNAHALNGLHIILIIFHHCCLRCYVVVPVWMGKRVLFTENLEMAI